jgi:hypothetical protein
MPEIMGYLASQEGRGRPKTTAVAEKTIDVADVTAVYALFDGADLIYVGEGQLGARLKQHHENDELSGQWDSFTWLSPWNVDGTARPVKLVPYAAEADPVGEKQIVELLELAVVRLAEPIGNRQNPTLANQVTWLEQQRSKRAAATIQEKVDQILELLSQTGKKK